MIKICLIFDSLSLSLFGYSQPRGWTKMFTLPSQVQAPFTQWACSTRSCARFRSQGCCQPHSPGWARVPFSSFFRQISIIFFIFFLKLPHFCPHFGSPGPSRKGPGYATVRNPLVVSISCTPIFVPSQSVRGYGIICPYLSASARSFYITLAENEVLPVFVDFN